MIIPDVVHLSVVILQVLIKYQQRGTPNRGFHALSMSKSKQPLDKVECLFFGGGGGSGILILSLKLVKSQRSYIFGGWGVFGYKWPWPLSTDFYINTTSQFQTSTSCKRWPESIICYLANIFLNWQPTAFNTKITKTWVWTIDNARHLFCYDYLYDQTLPVRVQPLCIVNMVTLILAVLWPHGNDQIPSGWVWQHLSWDNENWVWVWSGGNVGRWRLSLSGSEMSGTVCKKSEHLHYGPFEGWG